MTTTYEIRDRATFTLATGEKISVELSANDGLGIDGYSIRVIAQKGSLVCLPRADNSLSISTRRAIREFEYRADDVVKQHKGKTDANH